LGVVSNDIAFETAVLHWWQMKTIEVKTNIMWDSCMSKATTVLNEALGEGNWKVDTQNPKKALTVTSKNVSEKEVKKAVEEAGYKAEELA
jgi:copper chaperone CopZ